MTHMGPKPVIKDQSKLRIRLQAKLIACTPRTLLYVGLHPFTQLGLPKFAGCCQVFAGLQQLRLAALVTSSCMLCA